MASSAAPLPGALAGTRVVEIGDEQGEYCGLLLAGLGADVIRVEPRGGSATRRIGPFYADVEDPERSLYFWQYNRGKRSISLDLESSDDTQTFRNLVASADLLLDSTPRRDLGAAGASLDELRAASPALITARLSPFGDTGPWADWRGSDLVHLALGGPMMNSGYDPTPDGVYDTPPIAPQLWHAYHVAGKQLAMMIVAALIHQRRTGEGQHLSCAVHEAVAKSTEMDLMSWVMRAQPFYRQTCRHASERVNAVPTIAHTKDGRWIGIQPVSAKNAEPMITFLERHGFGDGLRDELARARVAAAASGKQDQTARYIPGSGGQDEIGTRCQDAVLRLFGKFTYANAPWQQAQADGLLCAPLRKPHESLDDPHWQARGVFTDVEHPELDRCLPYATSKWISTANAWQPGRRAPLIDEDRDTILAELRRPRRRPATTSPRRPPVLPTSATTTAGVLDGLRVLDFSWFLASAGGTRFLAALGAECLKVEWRGAPDTKLGAMAPVGGRAARRAATGPLPPADDPDLGGQFLNKNAGKRGISLNVRDPRGLALARRLVGLSDIVAEGFSPGVMDRWGLGYEALREIKPDVIYAQQSGAGTQGVYGRFRTVGPIAAAFAGTSEMSGLPEPAPPAGWGYSYLDWLGAYSFGLAILSALHHREVTGEGQWIDASQCESGIFASGTAFLDWAAHGRAFRRHGNRSPYKLAAPHGTYPCAGEDSWLAVACFDDADWAALCKVANRPDWHADPRFAALDGRLRHQDELDAEVAAWTRDHDAYDLMNALQNAGVAAGVCQTAADRCDRDPQLAALGWLTEITGTKVGTWPIAEIPVRMSVTPALVGGPDRRGAPLYGEDNEYVYGELLGLSTREIAELANDGVI